MKKLSKEEWLYAYERNVRERAHEQPRWEHWPAGHMYYASGISPRTAAQRFLKQTKWGSFGKRTKVRGSR